MQRYRSTVRAIRGVRTELNFPLDVYSEQPQGEIENYKIKIERAHNVQLRKIIPFIIILMNFQKNSVRYRKLKNSVKITMLKNLNDYIKKVVDY